MHVKDSPVDQLIIGVSHVLKDTFKNILDTSFSETDFEWKNDGVLVEVSNPTKEVASKLIEVVNNITEDALSNVKSVIVLLQNGEATIEGSPSSFGIKIDSKVVAVYE